MTEQTSLLAPVEARERVELLDILRGFAIFGILMVNMLFFSSPLPWVVKPPWTGVNEIAFDFIAFFFTGKFYSLFSMLFGIGLAVQMNRAEARGVSIGRIYKRRMLVLLLIGIVHAVFIWYGDILHLYAILGFLLLLFRNRRPTTLKAAVVVTAAIPVVLSFLLAGFIQLARLDPVGRQQVESAFAESARQFDRAAAESLQVYAGGSYREVLQQRLRDLSQTDSYAILFAPHVFAMFLLGLLVGRERWFLNVGERRHFFRRVQLWGLIIGVIGNAVTVISRELTDPLIPSFLSSFFMVFYVFGAPALMLFYASTIALATQNPAWRARLAPLGAVGRMALTNYLLQSLICTTIFYSHGLGLFGKFGPVHCILLTVVVYALQIPVSVWWLRRFQFGPAEWLWRTLTYGKVQPMRQLAA